MKKTNANKNINCVIETNFLIYKIIEKKQRKTELPKKKGK